MAFSHLHFNDQAQYGRLLRRALNMSEEADEALKDIRDLMIQMRDGDGSQDAHYAELTSRFGFVNDAGGSLIKDSGPGKTTQGLPFTNNGRHGRHVHGHRPDRRRPILRHVERRQVGRTHVRHDRSRKGEKTEEEQARQKDFREVLKNERVSDQLSGKPRDRFEDQVTR